MENDEVDITHTVKASESNGRQLLKNIVTGETRWEGECPEPELPDFLVPEKKSRKKKHIEPGSDD